MKINIADAKSGVIIRVAQIPASRFNCGDAVCEKCGECACCDEGYPCRTSQGEHFFVMYEGEWE